MNHNCSNISHQCHQSHNEVSLSNQLLPIVFAVIIGLFKTEIANIVKRYNVYTNRKFFPNGEPIYAQLLEKFKWKDVEIVKFVPYIPFRSDTGVHIKYLKKNGRTSSRIISFLEWYRIPKRHMPENTAEPQPVQNDIVSDDSPLYTPPPTPTLPRVPRLPFPSGNPTYVKHLSPPLTGDLY